MSKSKKKSNRGSYVPEVPWAEHIQAIAHRYPYVFPPAKPVGPHPKVDGMPVPGGMHTFEKKGTAVKKRESARAAFREAVTRVEK